MTDAVFSRRLSRARSPDSTTTWLLCALVLAALGFRLALVFVTNVNWDEFLYLSKVHAHLRGELASPFQSLQVHLFAWLPRVADNEVDQVIAGRLSIYVLGLLSTLLLYLIGRRFLEPAGALFALLCYHTFSYVVEHGASFRADPLCSFLFLSCLALLLLRVRPFFATPLAGLLMAVAVGISIKSLLYLPAIVAVFCILAAEPRGRRATLWGAFAFLVAFALGFALLYGMHRLALPAAREGAGIAGFAGGSAAKMFLLESFFPRWPYFLYSLQRDMLAWVLLGFGVLIALGRAASYRRELRGQGLLLLAFLLPLLVLPFYRNAFPYFYVFVLPPAILLTGLAAERVLLRGGRPGSAVPLLLVLAAAAALSADQVVKSAALTADQTRHQREIVVLAKRLFPLPVPYIERAGIVASYPRVGFFMSSWGIEAYRERGRPVFRRLIEERRPLFLIADRGSLDLARPWGQSSVGEAHSLLRPDYEVLKANYVPHWGPLYVAGKTLALDKPGRTLDFEVLIPGNYTLESQHPVVIDGIERRPGSVVRLEAGAHGAAAVAGRSHQAVLRWAAALYRPEGPPSGRSLYRGF